MTKQLPVVEMLGKNWIVDERLKQFRSVARCGDPIVFLSNQEMDDILTVKEFLDEPTTFEIDNEQLTKLKKLFDSGVEGDRDALNEIAKICHEENGYGILKSEV